MCDGTWRCGDKWNPVGVINCHEAEDKFVLSAELLSAQKLWKSEEPFPEHQIYHIKLISHLGPPTRNALRKNKQTAFFFIVFSRPVTPFGVFTIFSDRVSPQLRRWKENATKRQPMSINGLCGMCRDFPGVLKYYLRTNKKISLIHIGTPT